MSSERDIVIAMQEAMRVALCEAANDEIKKLSHKFECEMGKVKWETIAKIVNQVQIAAEHNISNEEYVIQLRLNGGKNDKADDAGFIQVVRCKDCKHWADGVSGCTDHVKCCKIGYYMVGENGYCVYGERKTDG